MKGKAYLSKVGRAIDELYRSFRPDSIWVMQSWSLRKAIVKAVPKERLLILDLNSARAKGTKGFWGYPYVQASCTISVAKTACMAIWKPPPPSPIASNRKSTRTLRAPACLWKALIKTLCFTICSLRC